MTFHYLSAEELDSFVAVAGPKPMAAAAPALEGPALGGRDAQEEESQEEESQPEDEPEPEDEPQPAPPPPPPSPLPTAPPPSPPGKQAIEQAAVEEVVLGLDLGEWLAGLGLAGCERPLRASLVERVEDLLVLWRCRLSLGLPLPSFCTAFPWPATALACHCLGLPLPWPAAALACHCLSLHCISLACHCLSLACHCLLALSFSSTPPCLLHVSPSSTTPHCLLHCRQVLARRESDLVRLGIGSDAAGRLWAAVTELDGVEVAAEASGALLEEGEREAAVDRAGGGGGGKPLGPKERRAAKVLREQQEQTKLAAHKVETLPLPCVPTVCSIVCFHRLVWLR